MDKRHRADGGRKCPSAWKAAIRVVHVGQILENINGELVALFCESAKVLFPSAGFGQKTSVAERAQNLLLLEFSAVLIPASLELATLTDHTVLLREKVESLPYRITNLSH